MLGPPAEGARGSRAAPFSGLTGRGAERRGLARFPRGRRRRPAWRTRCCCCRRSGGSVAPRGSEPAKPGPSSSSAAGLAAGSGLCCAGAAEGACGGGCCRPRRPARTGRGAVARSRAQRRPGGPRPRPPARPPARPRTRTPPKVAPRPSPSRRCGRPARVARCCCCRSSR